MFDKHRIAAACYALGFEPQEVSGIIIDGEYRTISVQFKAVDPDPQITKKWKW